MRPRDGGVRRADFRWRDLAPGIESNGLHGTKFSVPAGEVGQAASHDRRGHGNVAAAVELPHFRSGREIVSAVVMPAVHEDLCLLADLRHGWRAPGRHVLARRAPEFFAVGEIECSKERIGLYVAKHDDFAIMNDG